MACCLTVPHHYQNQSCAIAIVDHQETNPFEILIGAREFTFFKTMRFEIFLQNERHFVHAFICCCQQCVLGYKFAFVPGPENYHKTALTLVCRIYLFDNICVWLNRSVLVPSQITTRLRIFVIKHLPCANTETSVIFRDSMQLPCGAKSVRSCWNMFDYGMENIFKPFRLH